MNLKLPAAQKSELLYHKLSPRGHNNKKKVLSPSMRNFVSENKAEKIYETKERSDNFQMKEHVFSVPENYSQHYGIDQFLEANSVRSHTDDRKTRIAYISANSNSVHLDPEFFTLLQEYSDRQIAFVSIFGQSGSGKSLLLDELLHLAGVKKQAVFREQRSRNAKQISLFTWRVPFQKDSNTRIFLLDTENFFFSQFLSVEEQMMLDILLILSSSLIVLPDYLDTEANVLKLAEKQLKSRMRKLLTQKRATVKQDSYWPNSIYCPYRSHNIKATIKDLFENFNFLFLPNAFVNNGQSIMLSRQRNPINREYLRNLALMFKDIYRSIQPKQFFKLKFTGRVLIGLLSNMTHFLNLSNHKTESRELGINVDELFIELTRQLYLSAYNYQLIRYNQTLEHLLQDQQPKSQQKLLQILQIASNSVIQEFTFMSVETQLQNHYWDKLVSHIDQKQRLILTINQKKTRKKLRQQFKNFRLVQSVQDFTYALWDMKTKYRQLDHGQTSVVGQKIKQMIREFIQGSASFILQEEDEITKTERLSKRKQDLQGDLTVLVMKGRYSKEQFETQQKKIHQEHFLMETKLASLRQQWKIVKTRKTTTFGCKINNADSPHFILQDRPQKALQQKKRAELQNLIKQIESNQLIKEDLLRQQRTDPAQLRVELQRQIQVVRQRQVEIEDEIRMESLKGKRVTSKRSKKTVIK